MVVGFAHQPTPAMVAEPLEALDRRLIAFDARLQDRVSDLELERQVMDALNTGPLRVGDFCGSMRPATQLSGDIGVSAIYRNTAAWPICRQFS
jgi:hypothetical protein